MFLISNRGYPYPTPITESVQIRVFREPRKVSRIPPGLGELDIFDQDFYMFKLDRKTLFSDKPSSLVPITEQDLTFLTDFLGMGIDPFEWRGLADGTDPLKLWVVSSDAYARSIPAWPATTNRGSCPWEPLCRLGRMQDCPICEQEGVTTRSI